MKSKMRITHAENGIQVYVEEMMVNKWKIAKVYYDINQAQHYIRSIK